MHVCSPLCLKTLKAQEIARRSFITARELEIGQQQAKRAKVLYVQNRLDRLRDDDCEESDGEED
eukprot:m.82812 g.82812  ORF g.82812 m.82812 type:complete len:64 (-) comp14319_c0_seq4:810-1001(-)